MRKTFLTGVLVLLLSASFVFAESNLKYPKGACTPDGLFNLTVLHEGTPLYVNDLALFATDPLNNTFPVHGIWYYGFDQIEYIFPHSGNDLSEGRFVSKEKLFSAKGDYIISMIYLKNKGDLKPTKQSFAFNCPGKQCVNADDCASDEVCGVRCEKLVCTNDIDAVNHVCPKERIVVKQITQETKNPLVEKPTDISVKITGTPEKVQAQHSLFDQFVLFWKDLFNEFIV